MIAPTTLTAVTDCNPIGCVVAGEHVHVCGQTSGEWISANGFDVVHRDNELTFAN